MTLADLLTHTVIPDPPEPPLRPPPPAPEPPPGGPDPEAPAPEVNDPPAPGSPAPVQEPPVAQGAGPGWPFAGFWMGGFEGADHVNGRGIALDMVRASGHLDRLEEDHRRAAQAGLRCVRESIGWRLAEAPGGAIDLSRAVHIARSARRHGLQVLWTLMHYGLPADLCLHDDALIPRLARFAAEAVRVLGPLGDRPPVITPVNEISFIAWASAMPHLLYPPNHTPQADGQTSRISGYAVKRRLVRAALAAVAAVRRVEPRARFLHIDPVLHVVAPRDQPELAAEAAEVAAWQWQAWDLLCGRAEPDLGGHPAALDLLGINHYHSSQWEIGTERRLDWHGRDPRRRPLAALMAEAWQRYGRPLLMAETSHVGAGRADWLHEIARETADARRAGVPVHGICLYPLVDRPDWDEAGRWHRSGLFHVAEGPGIPAARAPSDHEAPRRRPLPRSGDTPCLRALRSWQQVLPEPMAAPGTGAALLVFTHLRWDFVAHRTRHLVSRLARWRRVVVVEEALPTDGPARLDRLPRGPCIDVLVPRLSEGAHAALPQSLLQTWLADQGLRRPIAWLTTPMAWPLASGLATAATVYDCADELAAFLGAPAVLPLHEQALLQQADLVLAASASLAGPRLHLAADRLQLVPNGVDAGAARRGRQAVGWAQDEAAGLMAGVGPGPRLGLAGVIDERLDLALVEALAVACPQWQLVMVGPVVKIDPARLPRHPNLHWLGGRHASLVPALMAHWQLGVLPFVVDASTRHAWPLKVGECLAAGLPLVATPLPELKGLQPAGVVLASGPTAFVAACAAALSEAPPAAARRRRAARAWTRRHGWHAAAAQVQATLCRLEASAPS